MAKILYLIITYTNPEQVLRLVKAIKSGSPESQVVIHHDYTNSKYYLSASLFEQFQEVYVLKNYVPVQWGHISWVQAVLCGISWAIENYLKFDWLVLLSGQDYPIQPIQKTEKFLEDTQYDGFMEHFLAEAIQENPSQCGLQWNKNTGIVRFFYQYYHLKKSPRALKSISFHLDRLTQWQPFVRAAIVQDRLLWGFALCRHPLIIDFAVMLDLIGLPYHFRVSITSMITPISILILLDIIKKRLFLKNLSFILFL
ncbi:MAG TPA: beta-1,6-N-acetylglucosaminyltransferase [Phormidium sp.]